LFVFNFRSRFIIRKLDFTTKRKWNYTLSFVFICEIVKKAKKKMSVQGQSGLLCLQICASNKLKCLSFTFESSKIILSKSMHSHRKRSSTTSKERLKKVWRHYWGIGIFNTNWVLEFRLKILTRDLCHNS